ncbi:MAG TPA: hypothetical protein VEK76_07685 [Candidatus Binatia bacterium]|nr:hypothetical protein [Candidatus Binatia bacterium]
MLAAGGFESALVNVHQRLGFALVVILLAGAVAAALAIRGQRFLPTVRAYLWLAFAAITVQAALGLAMLVLGGRPSQGLHLLYGPLTFVTLPATALLSRSGTGRREAGMLAVGFVLAFLFSIRALGTG